MAETPPHSKEPEGSYYRCEYTNGCDGESRNVNNICLMGRKSSHGELLYSTWLEAESRRRN